MCFNEPSNISRIMATTFAMGDLHGNYKALVQCLERSGFNKEEDTLIQLGDVADGYEHIEVHLCVEELLTIKNLIAIRGNHDVWYHNWFVYGDNSNIWQTQGGEFTVRNYENNPELKEKHFDFWNKQRDYWIDDENRLFVHGGFDLYYGFAHSKNENTEIRNMKTIHCSRELADFSLENYGNRAIEHLKQFNEIYIGHTAHFHTVFNTPSKLNIWNLDTGAGGRGRLTIMNIATKEYWQSDKTNDLYPMQDTLTTTLIKP